MLAVSRGRPATGRMVRHLLFHRLRINNNPERARRVGKNLAIPTEDETTLIDWATHVDPNRDVPLPS